MGYLDIYRFLKTYPDSVESNSKPVQKFIIFEYSLILKFKNSIHVKIDLYPNVYLKAHV